METLSRKSTLLIIVSPPKLYEVRNLQNLIIFGTLVKKIWVMQSSRSLRPVVRAKQFPGQVLKDCAHPIKIAEQYFFTDCITVISDKKTNVTITAL